MNHEENNVSNEKIYLYFASSNAIETYSQGP